MPKAPPAAKVVVIEPKEIKSKDFEPITDPSNVKEFIDAYFADIPIMKKVAACESHYRQFNSSGDVQRGEVNHYDVGVMQINELYHAKEAKALGLDLYDLDDNVAFARHLYEKSGTKPWNSSSPCWDRNGDLAINQSVTQDN